MSWSVVASVSARSSGGSASFTTASINTTGADLIIINAVSGAVGAPPPSDSKSNTWNLVTNIAQSGRQGTYMYYAHGNTLAVGTGHTFTSSNSAFGDIEVFAVSGSTSNATVLDKSSALSTAGNSASHTVPTTAITPTQGNTLVVATFGLDDASDTGAPFGTINAGFTIQLWDGVVSGSLYGGAITYLVQSTAASVGPTLTRNALNANGDTYHGLMASFFGAPLTTFYGWLPTFDKERPGLLARQADEAQQFFLKPASVASTAPVLWKTGDGGERPILLRRNDDGAPFFLPQTQPLWVPRLEGGERPKRIDPAPEQAPLFKPAAPAIYVPRSDGGERPSRIQDQSVAAFQVQPPATTPSTISGMAWWVRPEDFPLPPQKLQDVPVYFRSPASVPPFWLASAGNPGERPVLIVRGEDGTTYAFKPPPPPVGISGMAWWRQIEELVGPPPPQLDYHPAWDPQFVQQITPPPGPTYQFTVSGSGVSLIYTEFFVDVVFTDAPITKRTN